VLQDIIEEEALKLDWFFKASFINDLVNVSISCAFAIGYADINIL